MTFGTLNTYNLLKIGGADASTFLQGQLTNDVTLLDNQWQFSGYCNPKGRLLALLQLWKTDSNEFHALLSTDLTEPVVKRLRMYVMRSKVEIEVLDKVISGFDSIESLTEQHPDITDQINQETPSSVSILSNNQCALNIANRYLLISDQSATNESFDLQWQVQNIANGLPQITAQSAELFIPQMINLDLLDGISFKKGCYTGQEIIARMHYLGKLKQRMFACQIEGDNNSVNNGEKIYNNLDERKTVGNIVSVAQHGNQLLAVLKLSEIKSDLVLEGGQKINVNDSQPYSIPIE